MNIETDVYDFDDVLLVPQPSDVISREDVDLSIEIEHLKLELPIISSPMKGISDTDLITAIGHNGGLGILHRFYNFDDWRTKLNYLQNFKKYTSKPFGVAVGLNDDKWIMAADSGADIICVDIANGYLSSLLSYCDTVSNELKNRGLKTLLMAGNVVTLDGITRLYNVGVDMVRVGIGSGTLCTTRRETGVGYPQLSAIDSCSSSNACVVADGGIRYAGDIVKSLAAGADLVMIGSLFGKCVESPHNGVIYGMASKKLQEEYYHNTRSIEGIEMVTEKTTSVGNLLYDLSWAMRSGFTYLNAKNITELRRNATWVAQK